MRSVSFSFIFSCCPFSSKKLRFKRNNDWVLGVELLRDILYVMMYDFLCKLLPTDDKVFVKITQFDDKNVRE